MDLLQKAEDFFYRKFEERRQKRMLDELARCSAEASTGYSVSETYDPESRCYRWLGAYK